MKTGNLEKTVREITQDEFEEAMALYARAEQREEMINRNIEDSVRELLGTYEDELNCLKDGKKMALGIIQTYCNHNKDRLFARRRSIGTRHGIAGFRLGAARLRTKPGSDWKKIVGVLKNCLPEYVRTVEEPANDQLLADRHKEHVAPVLISLGLEVVQDELFYVETVRAA